jgi:hypothetical protein
VPLSLKLEVHATKHSLIERRRGAVPMRTFAWSAVALAVALTTACEDREKRDAENRVEVAGDRTGEEVRENANEVGDATEDAADDVADDSKDAVEKAGDAVEDASDEVTGSFSYERRDEFRQDVRERLDQMDKEIADLRRGVNDNAAETYTKAVAEAREARRAIDGKLERLGSATAANWNEARDDLRESLNALDRQLRALRPDAKPMGGTGPS